MTPIPEDLQQCRAQLERLRNTLNAHAIVSVADHRGIITYVNDKFCEVSGYTREELLEHNHRIVKSGVHDAAFYEEMWATIASGRTWQGEICNRRKDGSLYWVASTIVPFLDAHGVPIQYVSIRTDITALKRSQETLRLQARAMEASEDGIAIADARAPDLPLIYVNPAFTRITGYTAEEALGRNCRFLQNGDADQPGLTVLRAALAKGEPARVLIRNYRKDGTRFWNELVMAPVRDDRGVLTHFIGVQADVTARVEAEQALRESEARLREAQRLAQLGHWEADLVRKTVKWSEEIYRIFGTTPEQFAPSYDNFYACVYPEDVPLVKASELRAQHTGRHDVVHRIVRPDGEVRWVHELADAIFDDRGRVVALRGTVQDVTERTRSDDMLRQFRAALDASPDGIYIIDQETRRFVDCNEAAAAVLGYSRSELLALDPCDIKPAGERERLTRLFDQALAPAAATVQFETLHRRKDGSTFPVEIALRGMVFQGRRIVTAVARDISERKRAEFELRRSEALLREAQQIARLGHWKADLRSGLLEWSEVVYDIFGRDPFGPPPTLGDFYARLVAEDVPRVQAAQASAMATREVQQVDCRVMLADGTQRWVRLRGKAKFDPEGHPTHITGTVQDITAEKVREAELEHARDLAERANRAKSEFLSRMSHELRTPLNAILGFAQLMQLDPALDDRSRGNVKEIIDAGHHLLDLINEVLDLARIEAGRLALRPAPIDCAEVVQECVALSTPLAQSHDITLDPVDVPPGLMVTGDRTRVKQVLLNLLSNAIKYNRSGGHVGLRVRADGPAVARFEVSDTGMGIAPERQAELFEPFHRLVGNDSTVEGTGIGLAIAKHLVEAMSGTIGCVSQVGEGSRFWFTLPIADRPQSSAAVEVAEGAQDVARATRGHVLYIEYNWVNVRLMQSLFQRLPDVTLTVAAQPEAGLRLARETVPDLILLDINLPGMDGYEVLTRLRADAATAGIPVLAVSADAMPEHVERARAAGFDDYLTKPLDAAALFDAVERHLRASEVHDGSA